MADRMGNDFPAYTDPKTPASPYPLDEWFSIDGEVWCTRYQEDFDCTPASFIGYMRSKAALYDKTIEIRQLGREVYFRSFSIVRPAVNGNSSKAAITK